MREALLTAAAAVLAVWVASPAAESSVETDQVYRVIAPAELRDVLSADAARIAVDESEDDVTLVGEVDGVEFLVYFYECDGGDMASTAAAGSACLGYEYRAYFTGYPTDGETINAFNNAQHYGHLWRDDTNELALQLNVVVEGGITTENIRATFAWWRAALRSFALYMEDL